MNDFPQDELIRRLQQLGAIKPTPEATQQALARARQVLAAVPPAKLPFFRRIPLRRFAAAAAAVFLVGTMFAWLFWSSPAPAEAGFVEIQAAMKAPLTVSCRQIKRVPGEPDETSRLKMRNGRWRIENGDDSFAIADPTNRRELFVDSQDHNAKLVQGKSFSNDNLYDDVKNLPRNSSALPLEAKAIDGTNVLGFTVATKAREVTIWADAATLLPVRIESKESNDDGLTVNCSLDDFAFDEGLDPKLFVLEPPAGYKVETIGTAQPTLMVDTANLDNLVVSPCVGIGPVEFGMSREAVEKLLGLPDAVESVANDRVEALSYHSHGFGIAISKAKGVVSITCFAQPTGAGTEIRPFGGQTKSGLAMGASAAEIIRSYGPPDATLTAGHGLTQLRYNDLQAEFLLSSSDKLVQILLIRP